MLSGPDRDRSVLTCGRRSESEAHLMLSGPEGDRSVLIFGKKIRIKKTDAAS